MSNSLTKLTARTRLGLGLLAVATLGFSPCGAVDKEATDAVEYAKPQPQKCKSVTELAPALVAAVKSDNFSGVRAVVTQLGQPPAEGGQPYLNRVLQAVFVALHEFSRDPAEPGVTDEQLCNDTISLPLNQTNRLCDLRRILKLYVHQGGASKTLHAFDPVVFGVFAYLNGQQPASDIPHYEVARDLELMCQGTGQCDPHDTFDLLEGITSYLTPQRAQDLLTHLRTLSDDPLLNTPTGLFATLAGVANADGGADPTGSGFQLIGNELVCAVLTPDLRTQAGRANYFKTFDDLLNGTGPGSIAVYDLIDTNFPPQQIIRPDGSVVHSDLHAEISALVTDLKGMLDPNNNVYEPLQKALTCMSLNDPSGSLCGRTLRPGFLQLIFELGLKTKVVSLTEILDAAQQVTTIDQNSDQPGMVLFVLHDIVAALNRDPEALDALAQLCQAVFAVERPCDDGVGHDCPALPLNYQKATAAQSAPHLDPTCDGAVRASYSVPSPACYSNAEAALPEIAALFRQGVTDEVLCVLDTLVYGCAGGVQPACQGPEPIPDAGR
jgi:hypothetical protein